MKLKLKSLEIPITDRCNLNCSNCTAKPLRDSNYNLDVFDKSTLKDFQILKNNIHVEKIDILGGEPLLKEIILHFVVGILRDLHISDSINLITNGLLLKDAQHKTINLVDKIVISHYPGVNDSVCEKNKDRAKFEIREKSIFYDFYKKPTKNGFKGCKTYHEYGCSSYRNGYFYPCAMIPYASVLNGLYPYEGGGIKIQDKNFAQLLRADNKNGFLACKYCNGTNIEIPYNHAGN